jgi:glycosyltransferase involved in cell wall biosynthesis
MDRIEWVIVDDGTDCIRDIIEKANLPQIKYYHQSEKMILGNKRNYMHSLCSGDIIVYMDDDDYYPPERISHAVETLLQNPQVLCAGASEIYVYFKAAKTEDEQSKMVQFGPYSANHATAGTFAFRKELLQITHYNDTKGLSEEREFLKDYTIPLIQLDPLKTILVFSHIHNSFDKRKLLTYDNGNYMKVSDKKVTDFIKDTEKESVIYNFFMKTIDVLLKKYEPGLPKHKPDVLAQIKINEEERERLIQQHNAPCIYLKQPDGTTIPLNASQIAQIIQQQNATIQQQNQLIQILQQNRVVIQLHPNEPPMALTHIEIVDYINQLRKH